MTPVSICVIMKNEERHLVPFLDAIVKHFKNYPYELVLVDTGSTDASLTIAAKYTDKIYHFDWIGDFSAARNYSLQCASHDWILVLDCDEYILELDPSGFQAMIDQYPKAVGMLSRKNHYEMNDTDSIYTDDVERFFNRKLFHYEGIIHEQVRAVDANAVRETAGCDNTAQKIAGCSNADGGIYDRISIPLVADHCGYSGTFEDLCKKAERNNELLLKMLEENPNDPYLYFQIGQSYNMMRDDEKACYYYGKGLEYDVNPAAEYVQMMVIGYGYALLHLERYDEALQFQNIYDEFGSSADFVCLMGLIYLRKGMIVQAMTEFLKATTFPSARTEGSNTFIPTYNMGCINEVLGNIDTAVSLYKKCGNFKPALDRLKEVTSKDPLDYFRKET